MLLSEKQQTQTDFSVFDSLLMCSHQSLHVHLCLPVLPDDAVKPSMLLREHLMKH